MASKIAKHSHVSLLARCISVAAWLLRTIKNAFSRAVTDKQRRNARKQRHREIRREMRGLPALPTSAEVGPAILVKQIGTP